jgi:hypothetical protein
VRVGEEACEVLQTPRVAIVKGNTERDRECVEEREREGEE